MTSIIIPVHSFVDLITNSSSEIFAVANKGTITTIKKLVKNIIAATGGTGTADSLFTFELVYRVYDPDCDVAFMSEKEIAAKKAKLEKQKKNDDESGWTFPDEDGDSTTVTAVRVTAKDTSNDAAKAAAKVLSSLGDMFSLEDVGNY